MSGLADEVRAVDIVYLDSSKFFHIVSPKNLTQKLINCGLDGHTVRWIENQMNNQTLWWLVAQSLVGKQELMNNPEINSIPHNSTGIIPFNIWINNLDKRAECALTMFADDSKLRGVP